MANAREPNESMIKLTYSNYIDVNGDSFNTQAPKNAMQSATTFTVNWNCKNFLMLAVTVLPHSIALTMVQKLSFIIMISDASLATSVPAIPMAKPTLAAFS